MVAFVQKVYLFISMDVAENAMNYGSKKMVI